MSKIPGQRVGRRSAPLHGESHNSELSLQREGSGPTTQASAQIALGFNLNLPWILRVQSRNQV